VRFLHSFVSLVCRRRPEDQAQVVVRRDAQIRILVDKFTCELAQLTCEFLVLLRGELYLRERCAEVNNDYCGWVFLTIYMDNRLVIEFQACQEVFEIATGRLLCCHLRNINSVTANAHFLGIQLSRGARCLPVA
jgi:hypothetical protein